MLDKILNHLKSVHPLAISGGIGAIILVSGLISSFVETVSGFIIWVGILIIVLSILMATEK